MRFKQKLYEKMSRNTIKKVLPFIKRIYETEEIERVEDAIKYIEEGIKNPKTSAEKVSAMKGRMIAGFLKDLSDRNGFVEMKCVIEFMEDYSTNPPSLGKRFGKK